MSTADRRAPRSAGGSPASGYTLLEILVAAAILAMLFGLIAAYLAPTMRSFMRGAAQSEMQQQAVVTVYRLAQDLQRTPVTGFTLRTVGDPLSNAGMIMVPISSVNSAGIVLYSTSAVAYSWSAQTHSLTRCVFAVPASYHPPLGGFTAPPVFLDADVSTMLDTLNNARTLLATGVDSFQITHYGPRDDVVGPPVTVDMTLSRSGSFSTVPQTFELRRSYAFRNTTSATAQPSPTP